MVETLRVAIVSDGLYPYFTGGKEVRLYELVRRAVGPDLAVEVWTMRWWERSPRETKDAWQGVELRGLCRPWKMYVGKRRSIWQAAMFALGTLRVDVTGVDLIDVDHMPYLHVFPLWLVCRAKGVPLVITWHEWWGRAYWAEYLGPMGGVAAAIERTVARCADHLIVDSAETYDRLRLEGVPAQSMSLLPLGADLDVISEVEPSSERWDVMYSGRLLSHKRVHVLIEALALLRDRNQELGCLIVGSGPEEDRLRRDVNRLKLGGVVFAATKTDQREVWGLMKSARVFAYPSEREGFGLSVLEAQACGTTVVTTNHADNHGKYLVADGITGYLCDTSADGLADALQLALEHPADPEILRAHVKGYSWGPRAEQLAEIYRAQAKRPHAS